MLAHYGIDVLRPTVSLRRLWTLLHRLPPGVWPQQESPMSWSTEAHLLAVVSDQLAGLTYVVRRALGGKGSRPKPMPRPHARPVAPTSTVRDERGRVLEGRVVAERGRGAWAALAAALTGQDGVSVTRHAR